MAGEKDEEDKLGKEERKKEQKEKDRQGDMRLEWNQFGKKKGSCKNWKEMRETGVVKHTNFYLHA